ncbi:hypothetical protein [Streptomyces durhamensis]|uniref:hypothetical protein n=1 Tax=Streptomyces durhamensis TaxID=68194 RepID=UPI0012FE96DA|nr:hypothetical protein [Streptomyces durhamensis]
MTARRVSVTDAFPLLAQLRHYPVRQIGKNVVAGFALAVTLVPQALGYGQVAGLHPVKGGRQARPVGKSALSSTSSLVIGTAAGGVPPDCGGLTWFDSEIGATPERRRRICDYRARPAVPSHDADPAHRRPLISAMTELMLLVIFAWDGSGAWPVSSPPCSRSAPWSFSLAVLRAQSERGA